MILEQLQSILPGYFENINTSVHPNAMTSSNIPLIYLAPTANDRKCENSEKYEVIGREKRGELSLRIVGTFNNKKERNVILGFCFQF